MRELACRQVRARLDAYVDHDLSAYEQEAVRRHLETCKECRREAEALKHVIDVLRSHGRMSAPESVRAGVYARISAPEPHFPLGQAFLRVAAAAACCAAVLAGASVLLRLGSAHRQALTPREPTYSAIPRGVGAPLPGPSPATTARVHAQRMAESVPLSGRPPVAEPVPPSDMRAAGRKLVSRPSSLRRPTSAPMPASFLDVADSRGVTARELMYPNVPSADARHRVPVPVQAEEMLNDRVRIGERVLEIHGIAERDATGRLMAIRLRADSLDVPTGEPVGGGDEG